MDHLKGVILHGGHGTRLRPLTHTGPKQLIPVANKPVSQYVLEDLKEAGAKDIAIVLGDVYPEKVMDYYGDGSPFGVKITYMRQEEPKGIAHAVALCEKFVGKEPFIVYLGDNLLRGGIARYANTFTESNRDAMVLLCEVDDPQRFGVAKFDENGNLTGLVEKPREPPSNYALTGIYFFRPTIFKQIAQLTPSWRGELEITEALQSLMEAGGRVAHEFVKGWWKDTGEPEDILESNRLILDELETNIQGTVEDPASIQGRVTLGKDSKVMKGSVVRGPAVIGQGTTIAPDVYIGPYTSIGNHVSFKCGEIENSIVMDDCQIDIRGRIADSIIGPGSDLATHRGNKTQAFRFTVGDHSRIIL